MDDGGKQPHAFGSGQQRTHHPRPFFYVQPPSQPYYLYQHWQMNNPYSHYGLPGGFNFGRPCMHPYQYMQYPGFVFPHAPIYPMDYRRMFEPRFPPPTWSDVPRQQHHLQPQGRREMACSEVQTDPSDAITKLIECLDKIRASELQGAERELDSGVASQSSGMFCPEDEKKSEEQCAVPDESHLDSAAVTFVNSITAEYDGETSQRSLDALNSQECWSGGLDEELPLDSSSVHEDCSELKQAAGDQHLPLEKEVVTGIQSDSLVTDQLVPRGDAEELLKQTPPLAPSFSFSKSSDKHSKTEPQTGSLNESKSDPSYQILKLPFDSVLTPGAGSLSSPAGPYCYNYLSMQTTHERMSVLSPSLDELSSRDEMFSTDLEDVDLFPKHVYTGRRLAEVAGDTPQAAEGVEEVWLPGSKRVVCTCCGKSLSKGTSRSKVHSSKMYREEAGDSEEESRYGRGCEQPVRVIVRKHPAPRKPHSGPVRHATKSWYKRGQYKDPSDLVDQEEGHDFCKQEPADGEIRDMAVGELHCRTCQDGLCREDLTAADQGRWGECDAIPRRRQAAPLQQQEMSSQRKVMYHRPRDEDNDDDGEPPPLHWERDMEAATSTLKHSYGLGPPHGPQQAQGPNQPAPGPASRSSEEQHQQQHHHKPFFYIQPSQPYLPMQSLQWPVPMPMPVSYNPFYGYPGLGYGMPVMPHYQANPCLETPGFVVPHTNLHLMDYRRMLNPQYYQTMAYHSRRFRYQHNGPSREMTSSEVQTEPLSSTQRTSTPVSSDVEASGVLPVCSSDPSSIPISQSLSPVLAVQKEDHSLELKDMVPSSTTPQNGGFVIQTEELRIECCTTPVGLQLLHSHETAEMSHTFSQDVVQCSSILQGHVVQDEALGLSSDESKQAQVCPEIQFDGSSSTGEKIPALEECGNQTSPLTVTSNMPINPDFEETRNEKDLRITSKNFDFKVVHLPFDPKYLDELRKLESTVWSVEESLVSSPQSLKQNSFPDSHDEMAVVPSADVLTVNEDALTQEVVSTIELEDMVTTMESPGKEIVSKALCCVMDVSDKAPITNKAHTTEVDLAHNLLLLDNSPLKGDRNQHRQETNMPDDQDTSFESLPAYLPSTNWLADFENVYYCSKMPPPPKKESKPLTNHTLDVPSRRRKLDLEYKKQPTAPKSKERYKPKGKVDQRSLSDHECCLSRNFNENTFSPYVSKMERLCSRCLAKHRICTSVSPGLDGRSLKRKAAPFQQGNNVLLPTCETCKSHGKRRLMRKGSNPDVRVPHHGRDTEGESSENSSCRLGQKWRTADDPRKLTDLKRPLASKQNLERCPAAVYPKLREKNCMCNEQQRQPFAQERPQRCPHGNAIREMDENCVVPASFHDKWRNMDQIYLTHRWQTVSHPTEKSWKLVVPNHDGSNVEARAQNKHKKAQPQSQGTLRKDTRC